MCACNFGFPGLSFVPRFSSVFLPPNLAYKPASLQRRTGELGTEKRCSLSKNKSVIHAHRILLRPLTRYLIPFPFLPISTPFSLSHTHTNIFNSSSQAHHACHPRLQHHTCLPCLQYLTFRRSQHEVVLTAETITRGQAVTDCVSTISCIGNYPSSLSSFPGYKVSSFPLLLPASLSFSSHNNTPHILTPLFNHTTSEPLLTFNPRPHRQHV